MLHLAWHHCPLTAFAVFFYYRFYRQHTPCTAFILNCPSTASERPPLYAFSEPLALPLSAYAQSDAERQLHQTYSVFPLSSASIVISNTKASDSVAVPNRSTKNKNPETIALQKNPSPKPPTAITLPETPSSIDQRHRCAKARQPHWPSNPLL